MGCKRLRIECCTMTVGIWDYSVRSQKCCGRVVLIFLNHNNGLCERLADSSYFYTEESMLYTNFGVRITHFVHARNLWSPGKIPTLQETKTFTYLYQCQLKPSLKYHRALPGSISNRISDISSEKVTFDQVWLLSPNIGQYPAKKLSYVQRRLLHNEHSCLVWS